MWTLLIAAALAGTFELVPPEDARGTGMSPGTSIDAVLIPATADVNRKHFLQRESTALQVGDAQLQLFSVSWVGTAVEKQTVLIVRRDGKSSSIPVFQSKIQKDTGTECTLLETRPLPGGRIWLAWTTRHMVSGRVQRTDHHASVLAFGSDDIIQTLVEAIPIRPDSENEASVALEVDFPDGQTMVVEAPPGASPAQRAWVGEHELVLLEPLVAWTPRGDAIPVREEGPVLHTGTTTAQRIEIGEWTAKRGTYREAGVPGLSQALWLHNEGRRISLPLFDVPYQDGSPNRLDLRTFRRLHGTVYWVDVTLTVPGVEADTVYTLGWALHLRGTEARILADQVPMRRVYGSEVNALAVDVPRPERLEIAAESESLTYWQRKWLGTHALAFPHPAPPP